MWLTFSLFFFKFVIVLYFEFFIMAAYQLTMVGVPLVLRVRHFEKQLCKPFWPFMCSSKSFWCFVPSSEPFLIFFQTSFTSFLTTPTLLIEWSIAEALQLRDILGICSSFTEHSSLLGCYTMSLINIHRRFELSYHLHFRVYQSKRTWISIHFNLLKRSGYFTYHQA